MTDLADTSEEVFRHDRKKDAWRGSRPRHLDVYDEDGDRIGTVEDLYADAEERKVRFLEVGAGGILGLGQKRFLIPVEAVSEVREDGVVVVAHKRRKVAESPLFDAGVASQPPYQDELYKYYGYPPLR